MTAEFETRESIFFGYGNRSSAFSFTFLGEIQTCIFHPVFELWYVPQFDQQFLRKIAKMAFGDGFSGLGNAILRLGYAENGHWLPRKRAWCRAKILAKKSVTNNDPSKALEFAERAHIDEFDQNKEFYTTDEIDQLSPKPPFSRPIRIIHR